jgi:hypothetical protein
MREGHLVAMNRPEYLRKVSGELNSSKRPEVRKKISVGVLKTISTFDKAYLRLGVETKEKLKITQLVVWNRPEIKVKISGELNPNWRGGLSNEPWPLAFNHALKEQIRKRDNYRCQLCGIPQCECIRKLSVHHIDYDKENLIHANLISLCSRCNALVNFNRESWIKFFQERPKETIRE